jgi:hypothetical protein
MCLAIFIAANHRLPLSPKEQSGNAMHVAELQSSDEVVRKQFSNPYIYEIIGKDGCACDFQYDPRTDELLPQESRQAQANLLQLATYLTEALNAGSSLELYAGYCDELARPPIFRGTITPEELISNQFDQSESKFFTISKSSS